MFDDVVRCPATLGCVKVSQAHFTEPTAIFIEKIGVRGGAFLLRIRTPDPSHETFAAFTQSARVVNRSFGFQVDVDL